MASQDNPHSNGYYVMLVLAVVIGVVLGIGIFIWISMNSTGRTRIPIFLPALPTILLVGLVKIIDRALVNRRQSLPEHQNTAQTATNLYGQPGPAAEYGQPAPQVGGAAPYGRSQQPAFGYGQAQQPVYGYGAQPSSPGYGRTQQASAPGSDPGHGEPAYGSYSTDGYGQAPRTGLPTPDGQSGSYNGSHGG